MFFDYVLVVRFGSSLKRKKGLVYIILEGVVGRKVVLVVVVVVVERFLCGHKGWVLWVG